MANVIKNLNSHYWPIHRLRFSCDSIGAWASERERGPVQNPSTEPFSDQENELERFIKAESDLTRSRLGDHDVAAATDARRP
jgi:hypothetical protein